MKRICVAAALVAVAAVLTSGCVVITNAKPEGAGPSAGVAAPKLEPAKGPAVAAPPFDLPRLTEPPALDGELKEWKSAAFVPIHLPSQADPRESGHTWRGPADASIDAWIAWNDQGLCVAMIGYDDEITNDPAKGLWQQDSLKLYLDLRQSAELGTLPRSPGLCAFYMAPPPDDGKAHDLATTAANGEIAGLKVVGKRVKGGVAAEILIPWAAFPMFTPKVGSPLDVQFGLNDLDSADTNGQNPLQVSQRGGLAPMDNPDTMIRWVLADTIKNRAGQEQYFQTAE